MDYHAFLYDRAAGTEQPLPLYLNQAQTASLIRRIRHALESPLTLINRIKRFIIHCRHQGWMITEMRDIDTLSQGNLKNRPWLLNSNFFAINKGANHKNPFISLLFHKEPWQTALLQWPRPTDSQYLFLTTLLRDNFPLFLLYQRFESLFGSKKTTSFMLPSMFSEISPDFTLSNMRRGP